jgi:hypothetical protein
MNSVARRLLVLSALSVLPSTLAGEVEMEKASSKLRRFATDVIFVVEAGVRESYSKRLPDSILVDVVGQAPGGLVEKHVSEFCAITGVKKLEPSAAGGKETKVTIYFGSQAELEDKFIEHLLGVFGLSSRSREFEESCLSSKEQVMTSLQPVDKAVLAFYYRAVPSGTKPRELEKLFREKWAPKP